MSPSVHFRMDRSAGTVREQKLNSATSPCCLPLAGWLVLVCRLWRFPCWACLPPAGWLKPIANNGVHFWTTNWVSTSYCVLLDGLFHLTLKTAVSLVPLPTLYRKRNWSGFLPKVRISGWAWRQSISRVNALYHCASIPELRAESDILPEVLEVAHTLHCDNTVRTQVVSSPHPSPGFS